MRHSIGDFPRHAPLAAAMLTVLALVVAAPAWTNEVVLKDGRILRGRIGETASLAAQPGSVEGDNLKQIVFVNDDFRIVFVSRRQVQAFRPDTSLETMEKFQCEQPSIRIGHNNRERVAAVGPPAASMKDFDEHGRRTYPMLMPNGVRNVVQVITEITPQYARVQALELTWDMRIATNTLDDDLLEKLLMHQINPHNLEHRKKIVRFFIQAKRYSRAMKVLQKTLDDFKTDTTVAQELQPMLDKLHVMFAQQLLDELGRRRDVGQYDRVRKMLEIFPTNISGSTGEILQTVMQAKQLFKDIDLKRKAIGQQLDALVPEVATVPDRIKMSAAVREIGEQLDIDTLPRMAAYLQNQNVPGVKPDQLLSLAVSGWLLGADSATPNLQLALSEWRMHAPLANYLAEPMKIRRDRILSQILKEVASKPETIAAMAAHMPPPFALPDLLDENQPGYYKLSTAVIPGQPNVDYYVQLPPEYNPARRYPAIVSLHGIGMDPSMQIDWWAGDPQPIRGRQGHAMRNGYIVIAPEWTVANQKQYEYSAREHAAVIGCLRDACRRFSIDTDRIYLSGHSAGGDAAWDIGVSHPDLWAGVMPISADARNSCLFYTENARYVPFYVVLGELDHGRVPSNAPVLDRYLRYGFNTTVVEYLGRGHEHFSDEQLALFDWMGRFRRSFPLPHDREFSCSTMRPCDTTFWWLELSGLPPNAVVGSWPAPRGTRALLVHGHVQINNNITVTAGNAGATIWLSPEMVNFNARLNITAAGRRPAGVPAMVKPSAETLLEDLRQRADRQHPFWAKVEVQ